MMDCISCFVFFPCLERYFTFAFSASCRPFCLHNFICSLCLQITITKLLQVLYLTNIKVQLSFKRPSLLHLENDILEIPIGQNWKNWSVRHKTRFWQLVSHKNALALFSNWTAKVPIFNPEVNIYQTTSLGSRVSYNLELRFLANRQI